jgi:DNA-binding MarR family transcriptional regulator
LNGRGEGAIYRIALHYAGEDGRIALREQEALTPAEVDALRQRLGRLDKPRDAPWTLAVLRIIAANQGLAAREIAAMLGVDKLDLKRDIRKLKELGLTESLETGYRLSPRGRALLAVLPR